MKKFIALVIIVCYHLIGSAFSQDLKSQKTAMIQSTAKSIIEMLDNGKKLEKYVFNDSIPLNYDFTENGKTSFDSQTRFIFLGIKDLINKLDFGDSILFREQLFFIIAHEIGHYIHEVNSHEARTEKCNYVYSNCSKASKELEADIIATYLYVYEYSSDNLLKGPDEMAIVFQKLFKIKNEFRLCDYSNYANDYVRIAVAKEVYRQCIITNLSFLGAFHFGTEEGSRKNFAYNTALREKLNKSNQNGSLFKKSMFGEIPPFIEISKTNDESCTPLKEQSLIHARSLLHDGLPFHSIIKVVSNEMDTIRVAGSPLVKAKTVYQYLGNTNVHFIFNMHLGLTNQEHITKYYYVDGKAHHYKLKLGSIITVLDTFKIPSKYDTMYIRRLIYPPMTDSYYCLIEENSNPSSIAAEESYHFDSYNGSALYEEPARNEACIFFQSIRLLITNFDSIIKTFHVTGVPENSYAEVDITVPNIRRAVLKNSKNFSGIFDVAYLYVGDVPDNMLESGEDNGWYKQFHAGLQKPLSLCDKTPTKNLRVEKEGIIGEFEFNERHYRVIWRFERAGSNFLPKNQIAVFKLSIDEIKY